MATWAKFSCSAAKFQKKLSTTVSAQNPGKAALRIAAVKIFLNYLTNDRPEITILSLKVILILSHKLLKVMKEHPVKNSSLRMTLTIDACHDRENGSKNRPKF